MIMPCKGCILIPVCKHKTYDRLVNTCSKVYDYLYKECGIMDRAIVVSSVIGSTAWEVRPIDDEPRIRSIVDINDDR